jgi:hypothetical protein
VGHKLTMASVSPIGRLSATLSTDYFGTDTGL